MNDDEIIVIQKNNRFAHVRRIEKILRNVKNSNVIIMNKCDGRYRDFTYYYNENQRDHEEMLAIKYLNNEINVDDLDE